MIGESLFLGVAQIGAAIAGFGGVIAALRQPKDRAWTKVEAFALCTLVEYSLAAVVIGLLPSLLSLYVSDQTLVWSWASSLLVFFLLLHSLLQIYRLRGAQPRNWALWLVVFLLNGVVLYFQVENIRVWQKPMWLGVGMLWLICVSALQFYRSVTFLTR
jgi:hypothetical protein